MGEGLVPTAPLINMYLGLLCSKVMGGEGGGGVVCTAVLLGSSQAQHGLCDPL